MDVPAPATRGEDVAAFELDSTLAELQEAIIKGDAKSSPGLVQFCIDNDTTAQVVVTRGLIPAMDIVGDRFRRNEYYVPEVLIAARAMKAGLNLLRPLLAEESVEAIGKVVIGTAKGDLHDIGKNLVGMMLEGAGFDVIDLGTDCSVEEYVAKAREIEADIVAISALLTTTMVQMKRVVDAVDEAGLPIDTKVIIGGAPVTQQYADEVGADGYAPDAASGVALAKRMVGAAVEESADEAARRMVLEVRDLYESAVRQENAEDIRKGVLEAKDRAEEARGKGADLYELQSLLDAIDRELARHN